MYRLLNLWKLHSSIPLLLTNSTNLLKFNINCLFCKKLHKHNLNNGTIRHQSTNTALQSISKKKRRQKRAQKYLELLEVKNESTLQTKAPVSNLRAKHLALLINQPEITLDELHKLKNVKKQFTKKQNETVINAKSEVLSTNTDKYLKNVDENEEKNSIHEYNIENTIKSFDIDVDSVLTSDHFEDFSGKMITDPSFMEVPGIEHGLLEEFENRYSGDKNENSNACAIQESVKKKTIKENNRTKTSQISEASLTRDKTAREETLARLLLSYAGLCTSQGKAHKALTTLNFYRQRAKNSSAWPRIKDIRIYNCILEGFAAKGNIGKVRDILTSMEEEGIQKNIQTYLVVFECLGRMKPLPSVKSQLEIYQKEMNLQGITLNDIIEKGKFIYDQREVVLSVIKHLQPNFIPKYTPPYIQYSCPLIQNLNHSDQVKFLNSLTFHKNNIKKPDDVIGNEKITETNNQQTEKFIPFSNSTNLMDLSNINLSSNFVQAFNNVSSVLNNNLLNDANEPLNNINANRKVIQNCLPEFQNSKNNIKVNNLFTSSSLKEYSRDQLKIEAQGYMQVKSIEKETESSNLVKHFRKKLSDTQFFWKQTIIECIKRDLNNLHAQMGAQGDTKSATTLQACLTALPIEELAQLALIQVQKLAEGSETYSPTVGSLHRELGSAVHSRYQVRLKIQTGILDKVGDVYDHYCDWYATNYASVSNKRTINPRQCWQSLVHAHRTGPSIDVEDRTWPNTMIIGVGKFLYKIITKDLKIDVNALRQNSKQVKLLPAFYTVFRSQGHLIKEELKAHPAVTKLFRGAASPYLTFTPNMLPMRCPPRPWVNAQAPGGYLVMHTDIIRLPPQATAQTQRLASTPVHLLYPALDSLNQLAAVPWTVNQEILDIAIHIFQNDGSTQLGIAQPPSACLMPPPLPPTASKTEKYQAFKQRMAVKRKRGEMYSLWCDALYRFSLANHFRNSIFWLPHNMDFRGRVYPVPPHLTHLGSDLARSLLVFAESKPLGPNGLHWLKLHLINLTGTKKSNSIDERVAHANELIPEILDSADNPLTGNMWWSKSEEPWQTLACCREIANAIRCENPENYLSQFPIHQDGSCNGLQHYAALGRDAAGAKSVNLTPASEPQDVYAAVVELVENQRKIDADSGNNIAKILNGFVKRKVIKQTVMTTVYGVTRFGARLQIARQLKDIENFPKEYVWAASSYLTARTFDSIRTMFTSTREIQDWFTDCARLISGVSGQNVEWITPLGLPIVQPYSRFRKIDCSQSLKSNRIPEHFALDAYERPNVMKQKNAFPPNFIHSLDSCHMMLTSLFCENAGITFVSVHDCFWTHPISVPIMNKICREQFVALHSQPILQDLSDFLVDKYSYDESDFSSNSTVLNQNKKKLNQLLQKLPTTGNFQLESVLDSVYFFS